MFKFWILVWIGLIQVAVVLTFIFPDDDYFKQTKSVPIPRYATDSLRPTPTSRYASTTRKLTSTPRYETTTRVRRFTRRPTTTTTTTGISDNDIDIDIAIFNSCMESCPTTTEYDPICGTDGENYPNKSTLGCIRRCGIDVRMNRLGKC